MSAIDLGRLLHAALRKSAERWEQSRRASLARLLWLERLLQSWDSDKHRTLNKFLRSRAGRHFRRRQAFVIPRAKEASK
jgi:hypothetical protein